MKKEIKYDSEICNSFKEAYEKAIRIKLLKEIDNDLKKVHNKAIKLVFLEGVEKLYNKFHDDFDELHEKKYIEFCNSSEELLIKVSKLELLKNYKDYKKSNTEEYMMIKC